MTRLFIKTNSKDLEEKIKTYAKDFEQVTNSPDIVVIEENLAEAKKYKGLPIIFISGSQELEDAINIKKPFLLIDFFKTLFSCQKVYENNASFSLKWSNFELFINKKELLNKKYKSTYKLTEKEVDILKYFYKYKEKHISKKELLEEVWGYNPEMSTHTIETHIYRLRQKVEPTSETIIETKDSEYILKI